MFSPLSEHQYWLPEKINELFTCKKLQVEVAVGVCSWEKGPGSLSALATSPTAALGWVPVPAWSKTNKFLPKRANG